MMIGKKYRIGLGLSLLVLASGFSLSFMYSENGLATIVRTTARKFRSGPAQKPSATNQPPLLLKTIGVDLGTYDAALQRAGDFAFTKAPVNFGVIFMPFGFVIPGNSTNNFRDKTNPQVEFRLPMGTKVRSLVDGTVMQVPKLYSGDYSIMVSKDGRTMDWQYETEHVINPLVKAGDRVKAGQVIAEVSPHSAANNDGLGLVEIGILHGGNPPEHVCPFAYLDPSIREATLSKITAFEKAWETYRGNSSLYREESDPVPGCLTLKPVEG